MPRVESTKESRAASKRALDDAEDYLLTERHEGRQMTVKDAAAHCKVRYQSLAARMRANRETNPEQLPAKLREKGNGGDDKENEAANDSWVSTNAGSEQGAGSDNTHAHEKEQEKGKKANKRNTRKKYSEMTYAEKAEAKEAARAMKEKIDAAEKWVKKRQRKGIDVDIPAAAKAHGVQTQSLRKRLESLGRPVWVLSLRGSSQSYYDPYGPYAYSRRSAGWSDTDSSDDDGDDAEVEHADRGATPDMEACKAALLADGPLSPGQAERAINAGTADATLSMMFPDVATRGGALGGDTLQRWEDAQLARPVAGLNPHRASDRPALALHIQKQLKAQTDAYTPAQAQAATERKAAQEQARMAARVAELDRICNDIEASDTDDDESVEVRRQRVPLLQECKAIMLEGKRLDPKKAQRGIDAGNARFSMNQAMPENERNGSFCVGGEEIIRWRETQLARPLASLDPTLPPDRAALAIHLTEYIKVQKEA